MSSNNPAMAEPEVFILADQSLNDVVQQIRDNQWQMEMPADFSTRDEQSYTLRDIINYHAYDEAWVPAMMEGQRMDEVGEEKFGEPFGGDLLGDNPKESFAKLVQKSIDAVQALDATALDERTVHFSYGDFPVREALRHITSFRGLRVFDLAKALGLSTEMPPKLVQGLWDQISADAEAWREMGVFGPAVDVPADAPLQDRLLGLTGRQP